MTDFDPRPVIFLHIPKAGGSTLRSVLRRQYRERNIYEIQDDINGDILRFCKKREAERAAAGLLMGHMGFGLHRYIPGPSLYLTMLRQPLGRVLSEYRFLQSNPYHSLHDAAKNLSLMAYLQSDMTSQISNGQTRLLCGAAKNHQTGIAARRQMEERDLEQALDNLNRFFPTFGLVERYDESLLLWRRLLGWRLPFYVRENVTAAKRQPPPTEEESEYLREINGFDLELYKTVGGKLNTMIENQPASFGRELGFFRLVNRLYGKGVAARRRLASLRAG